MSDSLSEYVLDLIIFFGSEECNLITSDKYCLTSTKTCKRRPNENEIY